MAQVKRPRQPSESALDTAIEWLRVNEGRDGEADACEAVAAWLAHVKHEALLKSMARKYHLPVKTVREALQRQEKKEARA